MSVHIKICGITDRAAARAVVDAGVDAVGFVLAPSVRQITAHEASVIASDLPDRIDKVAVFRNPPPEDIVGALKEFAADVVQADFSSLADLGSPRLLPVFRETTASRVLIADQVDGGRFLFEGPNSGMGRTVDWKVAADIALLGQMTLAGGLDPDNVAEAIRTVKPFGVDVSSGVESSPGVKDPSRIRAFVEAAREAEKDLVRP